MPHIVLWFLLALAIGTFLVALTTAALREATVFDPSMEWPAAIVAGAAVVIVVLVLAMRGCL